MKIPNFLIGRYTYGFYILLNSYAPIFVLYSDENKIVYTRRYKYAFNNHSGIFSQKKLCLFCSLHQMLSKNNM